MAATHGSSLGARPALQVALRIEHLVYGGLGQRLSLPLGKARGAFRAKTALGRFLAHLSDAKWPGSLVPNKMRGTWGGVTHSSQGCYLSCRMTLWKLDQGVCRGRGNVCSQFYQKENQSLHLVRRGRENAQEHGQLRDCDLFQALVLPVIP